MDNYEILELLEPTFYVSTNQPYSINYSKLHDIYINPDYTSFFCGDYDLSISNWDFFQDPEHYYNVYIKQHPEQSGFFMIIIQQGHNGQGWASAKFLSYGIKINTSEMILDPITNEITFDFTLFPYLHGSQTTDYSTGGFDIIHEFETINLYNDSDIPYNLGEHFNINTLSDVSYKKCMTQEVIFPSATGIETVRPQEGSQNTLLRWKTTYPNGEYPNVDITIGLSFKNLLPNKYVPMDIRLHKWTSLDLNNLILMERGISGWEQIEKETYNTKNMLNHGHNRYRDSDGWKQLPPGFGSL